jgi:hypothetical protein
MFGKSYMNKTVNDFSNKPPKPEMIEPAKKLGKYKKSIVYDDGLSDIQMHMYRAMMEKKDKKEKAIKKAEELREL